MPVLDSYKKILQNLMVVAREPFTVKDKVYHPPDTLKISPAFFREYGCPLHCGSCCFFFSLDYTPKEIIDVAKAYPEVVDHLEYRYTVPINEVEFEIASIMPPKKVLWGKDYCYYLKDQDDFGCGIHKANPYTCHAELIKFKYIRHKQQGITRGFLLKGPYGRTWTYTHAATGIKGEGIDCTFDAYNPDQVFNNDIPVFKRLLGWAQWFEIETYLPEVISALYDIVENGVPKGQEVVIHD